MGWLSTLRCQLERLAVSKNFRLCALNTLVLCKVSMNGGEVQGLVVVAVYFDPQSHGNLEFGNDQKKPAFQRAFLHTVMLFSKSTFQQLFTERAGRLIGGCVDVEGGTVDLRQAAENYGREDPDN